MVAGFFVMKRKDFCNESDCRSYMNRETCNLCKSQIFKISSDLNSGSV